MVDHLDQDSATPGTSSSQAFADLQRQRSNGPSSRTRSQASEAFQTPAQGQTPLHAAVSSIAEEIEVQRGLREATRNQPSPGPPDFEDDPNYGIRVLAHQNPNRTLVPKHMFEKIDSFHLKLLQDNVISNSGTDHMKRWLKITSILEQINVSTLLLKMRTRPITDRETNVCGYTKGYTAVHEGRVFTISPDDTHKFTSSGRISSSWILYSTNPSITSLKKDSSNMTVSRYSKMRPITSKVTKLRMSSSTIRTSID
jgi:hypothetical protein